MKVFAASYYYNEAARELARSMDAKDFRWLNALRLVQAIKDPSRINPQRFAPLPPVPVPGKSQEVSFLISGNRHTPEQNHKAGLDYLRGCVRKFGLSTEMLGVSGPTVFVPVPSTSIVAGHPDPAIWPARDMIDAVAASHCCPIIRFRDPPPPKASQRGPRRWQELVPRLVATGNPPEGTQSAIVVDDVVTSGGHLHAVAIKLRELGIEHVAGFCVAQTTNVPVSDPWASEIFDLPSQGRDLAILPADVFSSDD